MDDCSKLAPTKAVNQRKWMLTKTAKIRLIRTNEPATALTILFFMVDDFLCKIIPRMAEECPLSNGAQLLPGGVSVLLVIIHFQ